MQAIIIGAQNKLPILQTPTQLIKIENKPIIQHTINKLENIITEAIIITTEETEKEIKQLKKENKKISTIKLKKGQSTSNLLKNLKKRLDKKYLVINGSTIYPEKEIASHLMFFNCILKPKDKDHAAYILDHDIFVKNPIKGESIEDWIQRSLHTVTIENKLRFFCYVLGLL